VVEPPEGKGSSTQASTHKADFKIWQVLRAARVRNRADGTHLRHGQVLRKVLCSVLFHPHQAGQLGTAEVRVGCCWRRHDYAEAAEEAEKTKKAKEEQNTVASDATPVVCAWLQTQTTHAASRTQQRIEG
jgi:hypothetical protein